MTPEQLQALAAKCEEDAKAGKVPSDELWKVPDTSIKEATLLRGNIFANIVVASIMHWNADRGCDDRKWCVYDARKRASPFLSSREAGILFAEELLLRAVRPLVEARVREACEDAWKRGYAESGLPRRRRSSIRDDIDAAIAAAFGRVDAAKESKP